MDKVTKLHPNIPKPKTPWHQNHKVYFGIIFISFVVLCFSIIWMDINLENRLKVLDQKTAELENRINLLSKIEQELRERDGPSF